MPLAEIMDRLAVDKKLHRGYVSDTQLNAADDAARRARATKSTVERGFPRTLHHQKAVIITIDCYQGDSNYYQKAAIITIDCCRSDSDDYQKASIITIDCYPHICSATVERGSAPRSSFRVS